VLMMSKNLNPTKALIFRIIHSDNMPWIIRNGLHCSNSAIVDPNHVNIGNPDLIDKRRGRVVDCPPGGALSDYVPFYFTPWSPMMYNIKTGRSVRQRSNEEIVIVVSSLHHLRERNVAFVFSDRHAYLQAAQFSSDLHKLDRIPWEVLQRRDFKKDDADKFERYQAEALVYKHLAIDALLGIVCYNDGVANSLQAVASRCGVGVPISVKQGWYF
jgi:hypothetical protein